MSSHASVASLNASAPSEPPCLNTAVNLVSQTPLWSTLQQRAAGISTIKELFRADPQRFRRFSVSACGMLLDYSKQRIDAPVLSELLALARQQQLEARRDAMLAGAAINSTEKPGSVAQRPASAEGHALFAGRRRHCRRCPCSAGADAQFQRRGA
ncbi:hypothetical protein ACFS07_06035 [Undibacterium arcticum]